MRFRVDGLEFRFACKARTESPPLWSPPRLQARRKVRKAFAMPLQPDGRDANFQPHSGIL